MKLFNQTWCSESSSLIFQDLWWNRNLACLCLIFFQLVYDGDDACEWCSLHQCDVTRCYDVEILHHFHFDMFLQEMRRAESKSWSPLSFFSPTLNVCQHIGKKSKLFLPKMKYLNFLSENKTKSSVYWGGLSAAYCPWRLIFF